AYSAMCHINPDFEICRPYIRKIAEYALSHPLPAGTIWNANFPAEAEGGACKIRLARQGRQLWRESPHKRPVPDTNQHYYWMGGVLTDCQEGENSDVHYLRQGFATLAPIHIDDLTHHEELQKRQEHFSQLFPDPGAGHA
ncbi:MAG: 5'/3'-nucleotidase SurE, partial [Chlamydiia bacterium]|nr:5'/3'-nucleotidase SurE [Chlamydiia bacterium]